MRCVLIAIFVLALVAAARDSGDETGITDVVPTTAATTAADAGTTTQIPLLSVQ